MKPPRAGPIRSKVGQSSPLPPGQVPLPAQAPPRTRDPRFSDQPGQSLSPLSAWFAVVRRGTCPGHLCTGAIVRTPVRCAQGEFSSNAYKYADRPIRKSRRRRRGFYACGASRPLNNRAPAAHRTVRRYQRQFKALLDVWLWAKKTAVLLQTWIADQSPHAVRLFPVIKTDETTG